MLNDFWYRLRALFRRGTMETELDEELRAHVEHEADKYVQSGLSRDEALRKARLEFGGLEQVKEECRDARGVTMIENTIKDLRYSARMLRKNPVFTVVAVATLALGIGANTAIFSLLDAVMLRFLPVEKPEELVQLLRRSPKWGGEGTSSFTNPLWEQIRDQQESFRARSHGEPGGSTWQRTAKPVMSRDSLSAGISFGPLAFGPQSVV